MIANFTHDDWGWMVAIGALGVLSPRSLAFGVFVVGLVKVIWG